MALALPEHCLELLLIHRANCLEHTALKWSLFEILHVTIINDAAALKKECIIARATGGRPSSDYFSEGFVDFDVFVDYIENGDGSNGGGGYSVHFVEKLKFGATLARHSGF